MFSISGTSCFSRRRINPPSISVSYCILGGFIIVVMGHLIGICEPVFLQEEPEHQANSQSPGSTLHSEYSLYNNSNPTLEIRLSVKHLNRQVSTQVALNQQCQCHADVQARLEQGHHGNQHNGNGHTPVKAGCPAPVTIHNLARIVHVTVDDQRLPTCPGRA